MNLTEINILKIIKDIRVAKYTFLNFIEDVLKQAKTPLTCKEIWEQGVELGLDKKLDSKGKTPWKSLGSILRTNAYSDGSIFMIVSDNPRTFWLDSREKELDNEIVLEEVEEREKDNNEDENIKEKYLHELLVYFLKNNQDFDLYCKTINHRNSVRAPKGKNLWAFPDIVGVHYPLYFKETTFDLLKITNTNPYKLYSFELKINLDFASLKECYFQAVSNSSWANEGYLVALHCEEDEEFVSELRRLNDAFGIGIIKLDAENPLASKILVPAKSKVNLDYKTINKLISENRDFKDFVESVVHNAHIRSSNHLNKSIYDSIFETEEEMEEHIKKHNII